MVNSIIEGVAQFFEACPILADGVFRVDALGDKPQEYTKNIANSSFYEDFAAWVEAQDAAGSFPELPKGMHAEQLTVLSSGYLFDESMQNARYQIQLELIYHKEA